MSFDFASLARRYERTGAPCGVELFHSPLLLSAGCARHGFTGRSGGVSAPPYDSLNLGFSRPEPRKNVLENYSRLAKAARVPLTSMTLAAYAHGNAVHNVTASEAGSGIVAPPLPEADGLVAREGVTLVTLHADCLCVLFYDPESGAYGACHAGWRGVAGGVAVNTLKALAALGAKAQRTLAWIGPGICPACYEVDSAVIAAFEHALPEANALQYKSGEKAQLDLTRAMAFQLLCAGMSEANLQLSGLCTSCSPHFFSYRRDNGQTGAMAGYILGTI